MHKIIIPFIIISLAFGGYVCAAEETRTADRNNDGKPDTWIIYDGKGSRTTQVDLNFDGKPDMYSYYQNGQRVKLEVDVNYDGKLDQVNEYMDNKLVRMQKDSNKDGKLELIFDRTDFYSSQKKHTEYYKTYPQTLGDSKTLPEK
ncbi:MAG: hypothetical protein KKB22_02905 [Candidatus Omnitrophica bacterium]|nr:hypothetical protein [Candidatus Omnitrophota bacterium]